MSGAERMQPEPCTSGPSGTARLVPAGEGERVNGGWWVHRPVPLHTTLYVLGSVHDVLPSSTVGPGSDRMRLSKRFRKNPTGGDGYTLTEVKHELSKKGPKSPFKFADWAKTSILTDIDANAHPEAWFDQVVEQVDVRTKLVSLMRENLSQEVLASIAKYEPSILPDAGKRKASAGPRSRGKTRASGEDGRGRRFETFYEAYKKGLRPEEIPLGTTLVAVDVDSGSAARPEDTIAAAPAAAIDGGACCYDAGDEAPAAAEDAEHTLAVVMRCIARLCPGGAELDGRRLALDQFNHNIAHREELDTTCLNTQALVGVPGVDVAQEMPVTPQYLGVDDEALHQLDGAPGAAGHVPASGSSQAEERGAPMARPRNRRVRLGGAGPVGHLISVELPSEPCPAPPLETLGKQKKKALVGEAHLLLADVDFGQFRLADFSLDTVPLTRSVPENESVLMLNLHVPSTPSSGGYAWDESLLLYATSGGLPRNLAALSRQARLGTSCPPQLHFGPRPHQGPPAPPSQVADGEGIGGKDEPHDEGHLTCPAVFHGDAPGEDLSLNAPDVATPAQPPHPNAPSPEGFGHRALQTTSRPRPPSLRALGDELLQRIQRHDFVREPSLDVIVAPRQDDVHCRQLCARRCMALGLKLARHNTTSADNQYCLRQDDAAWPTAIKVHGLDDQDEGGDKQRDAFKSSDQVLSGPLVRTAVLEAGARFELTPSPGPSPQIPCT